MSDAIECCHTGSVDDSACMLQEAPMSQSNNNSDDPLFIMHIGATYAVRISVLHGSSHGLMALPVHGVVRVRLQGGRGNDAQEIDVSTLSEEIGKWDGFGIWDTSTHAQPLADRPAQQVKADLTFKLRMKVRIQPSSYVAESGSQSIWVIRNRGRQWSAVSNHLTGCSLSLQLLISRMCLHLWSQAYLCWKPHL